ncbi:hypothetical protein EDD37DRAFT_324307 [Exophiala viscosa]|uniref:uncharacterized protein n=1 Tax=Exophiala viscosa TaxID=2486360 RepID=UPI0021986E97|nr:hypothetical protein EDD37DRAFT_324307 [Exophiala viscosa]
MSSRLVAGAMVIGFGILNGYMIFKPAFEEMEMEKLKKENELAANLGPHLIEIPVQTINSSSRQQASQTG